MKRLLLAVGLTSLVFGALAWGQQAVTANQGAPGKQGAWPVVISGTAPGAAAIVTGPDGGAVRTQDVQCTGASSQKITTTGLAAVNTPSAQATGRIYIELCNSLQNSSNPIVKCRVDGTVPVAAAGNLGDVLGVGDCIRYTVNALVVPSCISDAATTYVTSYECVGNP